MIVGGLAFVQSVRGLIALTVLRDFLLLDGNRGVRRRRLRRCLRLLGKVIKHFVQRAFKLPADRIPAHGELEQLANQRHHCRRSLGRFTEEVAHSAKKLVSFLLVAFLVVRNRAVGLNINAEIAVRVITHQRHDFGPRWLVQCVLGVILRPALRKRWRLHRRLTGLRRLLHRIGDLLRLLLFLWRLEQLDAGHLGESVLPELARDDVANDDHDIAGEPCDFALAFIQTHGGESDFALLRRGSLARVGVAAHNVGHARNFVQVALNLVAGFVQR